MLVDDGQRRVLRGDEGADAIDDHLQHIVDRGERGDAADGGIEGVLDRTGLRRAHGRA